MRRRNVALLTAMVAVAGFLGMISVRLYAQSSKAAAKSEPAAQATPASPGINTVTPVQPIEVAPLPPGPYDWRKSFASYKVGKVPRTADGKPDLQGLWSHSILTPLERPGGTHTEELSQAEAEEQVDTTQQNQINLRIEPTVTPPGQKTTDAYNTFWRDGYFSKIPITSLRTSQVVDPPDGHVPELTAAAKEHQRENQIRLNRPATGPEDRPLTTRCVRGFYSGPPIIGRGAGNYLVNLQIVESPSAVVVRQETQHEDQIIPIDDNMPLPSSNIELDKGVARGHWEGDVLVVDSTNFAPDATGVFSTHGTSDKLHIEERWKRLDDEHLLYGFTIDDPGTWVRPWSVEFVMWRMKDQEQLVEYACHEGNVSLEFALSGARAKEREDAEEAAEEAAAAKQQQAARP